MAAEPENDRPAVRLPAICPGIRKEAGRIVATTAWRVRSIDAASTPASVVPDETTLTRRRRAG